MLAITLGAAAQDKKKGEDSTTRTVEGFVTDAGDQPAPKSVVQLKDTKTLQVRSYITQADGAYHFAGLSTNVDYELKAEKDGASSDKKTLSVFDSRKKATINLKLNK
jgi:hypothetical protein